jgi:hypothetical protein
MVGAFNPKDLVFVDETGTHTAFMNARAGHGKFQGLFAHAPDGFAVDELTQNQTGFLERLHKNSMHIFVQHHWTQTL